MATTELENQRKLWAAWKAKLEQSRLELHAWEEELLSWDGRAALSRELSAKLSDWDWQEYKLGQLGEYQGHVFRKQEFKPTVEWDHDHCEGCGSKFAGVEYTAEPDVQYEGYVTYRVNERNFVEEAEIEAAAKANRILVTHQPIEGGQFAIWVCSECFEQFRAQLGRILLEN